MPLDRRELERLLLALGVELVQSDHRDFILRVQGRFVAKTSVSHGASYRTLSDEMVATVARQIHINRRFLLDLVAGRRSREDYYNHLRDQGLLE